MAAVSTKCMYCALKDSTSLNNECVTLCLTEERRGRVDQLVPSRCAAKLPDQASFVKLLCHGRVFGVLETMILPETSHTFRLTDVLRL